MATQQAVLPIVGMNCGGCVRHVNNGLEKMEGVTSVSVSLADKNATVQFDPEKTNVDKMVAAVQAAGYKVVVDQIAVG
jgi:copper chaperone CopZ